MKQSELYENIYPFEDLLPELKDEDVQEIVNNCDYTFEADRICELDNFLIDNKVNIADAAVFYKMGYQSAQERIDKMLKPKGN